MLLLELYWCFPVEVAVSAAGVVEPFDVFEHRVRQLDMGVPALTVQQFYLDASPEGLGLLHS